jgi:glycosyltransferase involved in cell wall biosynthesis
MKISVLMTVYNTPPHHLMEAFMSIVNQTLPPDEIIIMDDGSHNPATIKTINLCRELGARTYRIYKNLGMANALNTGFAHCKNEWIALMDSDDISFPERFQKQADFIKANPETHVLGTGIYAFKSNDPKRDKLFVKTHPSIVTSLPENLWIINHATAIYHRSILAKCSYDKTLRRASDIYFFRDVFNQGFLIRNIPDILYAYRKY